MPVNALWIRLIRVTRQEDIAGPQTSLADLSPFLPTKKAEPLGSAFAFGGYFFTSTAAFSGESAASVTGSPSLWKLST